MELAVIISAVTLAAAFIGWRVVSTVRVARGKDLCWYGARTIEGLPRVRALVEQHGKRALA
jgi:hypothetical protein